MFMNNPEELYNWSNRALRGLARRMEMPAFMLDPDITREELINCIIDRIQEINDENSQADA